MFTREITINGITVTEHRVAYIMHTKEAKTHVMVEHSVGDETPLISEHIFPLALGLTFEQAEQLVMELPEYAEATPEQSLMERMRAMLTAEQLAELGLGE